ncbi:MAG: hypothetical protein CSB48_07040, partial [Proteobacteria bacterium]
MTNSRSETIGEFVMFTLRKSITAKYILSIFPIIALFTLSFCVVIYQIEKDYSVKQAKELGITTSREIAHALESWLEHQIKTAKIIAENPDVVALCKNPNQPLLYQKVQVYLQQIHNGIGYYENI